MDDLVRINIAKWNGANAGRAPSTAFSQDGESPFRGSFLPQSADARSSQPNLKNFPDPA
jgi:hypothetical protein